MDSLTELAGLLKERDNKPYYSPQLGVVLAPPPEIKVQVGDSIILTKKHLYIAARTLQDYEREYEFKGNIQFTDSDCGTTKTSSSHSHGIETINIDTTYTADGKMKWVDTLVKDDEVMLIPTEDRQRYFLIDKVVTL